jgi:hypothetical protein
LIEDEITLTQPDTHYANLEELDIEAAPELRDQRTSQRREVFGLNVLLTKSRTFTSVIS